MRCKKCGTELRSDDEFCYRCGKRTTIWQRLFASRAIVGSSIAIVIVALASVLTWMILTGRVDLSKFRNRGTISPGTENAGGGAPSGNANAFADADTSSDATASSGAIVSAGTIASNPVPTAEPVPAVVMPVDVTMDKKEEMKRVAMRIRPFLAFSAAYYKNGRHVFKWDDSSATVMALYNLQYLDKKIKYGTPFADVEKKAKREVKDLFGSNAKYKFAYSGQFPDYVFVKSRNTVFYNVARITGKTYDMKTEKIIQYQANRYRLIVSAGLVLERNKKEKGYFQKYTVFVEQADQGKYGFVIRKIRLYEAKDAKTR